MPEGDTVYQLWKRQQPLEGRVITAWDARVPSLATTDATGAVIEKVWPWGKHLFWRIASDRGADILHTHLRMDGTWRVHAAGSRWSAPAHTARLVVRVAGAPDPAREVELVGHDLGMVELWPAEQYAARTAHLGPDPLAGDWDSPGRWDRPGRDEALARLAAQARTSLGEALLDQRVIAGLGNVFRAELCFLLGVHPASDVRSREPEVVVDRAAEALQFNRDRVARLFTGVDRAGERTFVYGREGQPCRRCGTPIRSGRLGGATTVADSRAGQDRIIYWCPNCQPVLA